MAKANSIFIESTSGPTKNKQDKAKSDPKSVSRREKSTKKALVSPFKKIYETGKDMAKLKIKQKSKSNNNTTIKRDLASREEEYQNTEIRENAKQELID